MPPYISILGLLRDVAIIIIRDVNVRSSSNLRKEQAGTPKCYVLEREQTDLQTDNQTGQKLYAPDLSMWGYEIFEDFLEQDKGLVVCK